MGNYATLKAAINSAVYTNGNEEITAAMLNSALQQMISSLGAGYQFMGVATPSMNPGAPDQKVCYLAATPGTYSQFGSLTVAEREVCVFKYATAWTKETLLTLPSERPAYDYADITEDDFTIASRAATLNVDSSFLGYIMEIVIPTPGYWPLDGIVNINFASTAGSGDTILLISVPSERAKPVYLNGGYGGVRMLYPGRVYRVWAALRLSTWYILSFDSDPESPGLSFLEIPISEWQISGSDAELTLAPEVINGRLVRVDSGFVNTPNTATVRFARTPGVNGRCVIEVENGAGIQDYSIEPDEGYTDTIDLPRWKSAYLTCEIINGKVWVTGVTYYEV